MQISSASKGKTLILKILTGCWRTTKKQGGYTSTGNPFINGSLKNFQGGHIAVR